MWRHNLPPQLLPTFKSISRIICKMGHFFKRDNLSFRSEIYVQYIQYIQIKFYFTDRNIYYGNNLCVAVSRFDTTCQYQLLSSSLSHSPKYYNTQITASIYAKNSTHWNGHCQCRLCKWWMFLSLCLCYVWYWEVATAKGRFIRQRGSSHSATPYYWLLQCIIIYL